MAKGLMIDVIAPAHPDDEEAEGESADVSADAPLSSTSPRQDGDAIIQSIESQLAKLRSLVAGL